jgi:hypothetical protein
LRLLLCTHNRLFWYFPHTGTEEALHEHEVRSHRCCDATMSRIVDNGRAEIAAELRNPVGLLTVLMRDSRDCPLHVCT